MGCFNGLNDRKISGISVFDTDESCVDPISQNIFHSPGHGCRGLAAPHHHNSFKPAQVKGLGGFIVRIQLQNIVFQA